MTEISRRKAEERRRRLAAALRENLAKRKAQEKGRQSHPSKRRDDVEIARDETSALQGETDAQAG